MSGRSPLSRVTDRRYYGVVPAIVAPFPDGDDIVPPNVMLFRVSN